MGLTRSLGNANPSGGAPQENQAPAPPLANAEQTVYDLYYEMSFNRVDATWAMLSPRLQERDRFPRAVGEREDIYTFTYMEFTSLSGGQGRG